MNGCNASVWIELYLRRSKQRCAVQSKLAAAALVFIRQPGGGGNRPPGLDPWQRITRDSGEGLSSLRGRSIIGDHV